MVRVARNEPRRRARRAARNIRAAEKAESDIFADLAIPTGKSEVLARSQPGRSRLERRSPARIVALSFLGLCAAGTLILMLPGMAVDGRAPLSVAMFTSVSAGCVTGLSVTDVYTYWTPLGQVAIMALIQVGGFGIQALGTLWILLLNRKLGATSRLTLQTETGAMTQGEVRHVLRVLAIITLVVESSVTLLLSLRLWMHYDTSIGSAAWKGAFHSVMAFNNSGFVSLAPYAGDPFILGPISLAIIFGGLGFLVVVELFSRLTSAHGLRPHRKFRMSQEDVIRRGRALARRGRYRLGGMHPERLGFANPIPLSLHTRLVLIGTAGLWVVGTIGIAVFEWTNQLDGQPLVQRMINSFFSGAITPRTAGFNIIDYEAANPETRLLTDAMMFVGAGSGSTSGGIKITTLMILIMAVLAEVRGYKEVNALDRRIPDASVRIAVAVTMAAATAVMIGTMILTWLTDLSLDFALFEVISALSTVGLTANVTPTLPALAQLLLIVLMLLGRIGPITLASSLTLHETARNYRLPEGRPMIG